MAEGPLEIEDLPGVGPSTADKLREGGYLSVESIATASPAELSEISEISESTAKKIIKAAREAADVGGFKTGRDIFEARKDIRKLSFRVPELDALLGGGMESQAIDGLYRDESGAIVMCANCRRTRRAGASATAWDWVPTYVERTPASVSPELCAICSRFNATQ